MDQPERLQRLAAAVDEVAAEPQPVDGGIEADLVEQPDQRVMATLHVADGVGRHQCRVRGMLRVNGSIGASNAVPSSVRMR